MLSQDNIYEIMLHLDYQDLESLCTTNTAYLDLCQDNSFWQKKITHDDMIFPINKNINWLKYYKLLRAVNNEINSMKPGTPEYEYKSNTNNTDYFIDLLEKLNVKYDMPFLYTDDNLEFGTWYKNGLYYMEFIIPNTGDIIIPLTKHQLVSFLFNGYYDQIIHRIH